MIKTISYVSSSTESVSDEDLQLLFKNAKKYNTQNDISGILVYNNGNFLQILEGEEKGLDELFRKIERDDRHKNIITLIDYPIPNRLFQDYDTAFSLVNSSNEFEKLTNYIDWLKLADSSCSIKAVHIVECFLKS